MPVQRDDSSTQQHHDDHDANLKLRIVGEGGGRLTILTLDPTQSMDSKKIFDQVRQLSSDGKDEIDVEALLKAVATQAELKATVHRQKKMIGKLIFGFAATAIVLFAVTLGSSFLSGNLIKELYLGPSSSGEGGGADEDPVLQDASGNVVATGIAKDVFRLTDLPGMPDGDLLGLTRVTMQVGAAIRHYEVDAVAKRCGVVQIQSQKTKLFVDDSYVSIVGLGGERSVLAHHPTTKCDKAGCRMLARAINNRAEFNRRANTRMGMTGRRLEDRLGSLADSEATARGREGALLDAPARQLLASPERPPAFQLKCDDSLEDVLDHTCAVDMNYSVQCPSDCDCKSAEKSIHGCNPYTADSRICCSALLHGVKHPAAFLIHTAGAHSHFDACTFVDSAVNPSALHHARQVQSQSAGPYSRSFRILGDHAGANISAFTRHDLGGSVDQLSIAMDGIGESLIQVNNNVETVFSTVENISKAVKVLLELAELTKTHHTSVSVP